MLQSGLRINWSSSTASSFAELKNSKCFQKKRKNLLPVEEGKEEINSRYGVGADIRATAVLLFRAFTTRASYLQNNNSRNPRSC